jgi:hypothetical protein
MVSLLSPMSGATYSDQGTEATETFPWTGALLHCHSASNKLTVNDRVHKLRYLRCYRECRERYLQPFDPMWLLSVKLRLTYTSSICKLIWYCSPRGEVRWEADMLWVWPTLFRYDVLSAAASSLFSPYLGV